MIMIKGLSAIRNVSISNLNFIKIGKRMLSISKCRMGKEERDENIDVVLEDKSYYDAFKEIPFGRSFGHSVLAIQPNMKDIPERAKITNAELQLSELCALAASIPRWVVVDKQIHSLKRINKKAVFGKGKLEEVTQYVRQISGSITAIMIGINTLNSLQLSFLQNLWGLPVYDRYTMVLEIFRTRATTSEAKLQVALAEINYLRMHLHGLHSNSLDFQKEGLKYVGGLAETTFETRKALLRDRETKIKKQIDKIGTNRTIMRESRKKLDIPVVAIVGYTNAGKTSLIKSLTGNSKITPLNQLFATLDINCFQGFLPSNIKVLYLDTVGFISEIPDALLKAFSVTLEDVVHADLLIHVSDASHPDQRAQDIVVNKTLANLPSMPQNLLDNMIKIYNKVDLLHDDQRKDLESESTSKKLLMSVAEGWGRQELLNEIQESLMKTTGRITKKLRVPAGGAMLTWLYKETAVEEVIPDANNPDMYLVKVVMSLTTLSKFNAMFKPKNK